MEIKLLIEALGRPWFIEPQSAAYYAAVVHKLISGQEITEFNEKQPKGFSYVVNAAGKRIDTAQGAIDNGVAVINLKGAVMKYDYCGAPGTQSLIKAINAANDNPSISAIVLQIDSPGGSVDGTQQMANAVKNSKKPVVAYINGMMASAAMWIGSAASDRIASSNTDIIGSIGTMASWSDWKGYYEKQGAAFHEVYASASTHKNMDFREASAGNYEPMIQNTLDPLNNEFIQNIKSNLPQADPSVFNGAHYIAVEAKKKGLINKIGTFESAVKTALQLGKQKQQVTKQSIMAFERTLTAAQTEQFEVIEGGFLLTEEHLNSIEATIAAHDTTAITGLQTQLSQANDALQTATNDLNTANNTITERDARIIELEARVSELEQAPAADFEQAHRDRDELGSNKTPFHLNDKNPMNQFADSLFRKPNTN